ncbi:MAG TPA: hypothetical protein PKH97_15265, partial [Tetrasphaera sp.]|uniref:hypothetical protein n=1 Tax=Nostocoides sp. TaxID=1917966 RepID=UPI002BA8E821
MPGITHDGSTPAGGPAFLAARRDPRAAVDFAGVVFAVETLEAAFLVGASTPAALPAGAVVATFFVARLAVSALAAEVLVADTLVAPDFRLTPRLAGVVVASSARLAPSVARVGVASLEDATFFAEPRFAGARRTDAERRDGVVGSPSAIAAGSAIAGVSDAIGRGASGSGTTRPASDP